MQPLLVAADGRGRREILVCRLPYDPEVFMSEWMHGLPVVWMAIVVFLATFVVTGCIYALVMVAARGERARAFKAVSPGMLPPLGIIFGLFVAFLASQVWSDLDRAQAAVTHEASALRAAVLLIGSFPGEPEARMKRLIRLQIEQAVTQEWPAMSRHRATLTMVPPPLAEALQLTLLSSRERMDRLQRSARSWLRWETHSTRAVNASS